MLICDVRSRCAAAFSKLAASLFSRQAISRTPTVTLSPSGIRQPSTGAQLPSTVECHQRRRRLMRPFTVRNVVRCRPLFRSFFDVEPCGGGKSGFRRIHFLLQGRLEGGLHEDLSGLAYLFFARTDPVSVWGRIDRSHDLLRELWTLLQQQLPECLRSDLRRRLHHALLANKIG